MSTIVIDSERTKLLYGPYVPPKCAVGDRLACEYRGREVTVRGMTDAPIQWPASRRGSQASPIVCGDLIRAIRTESVIAVAYHWGVWDDTVSKWRRALGVPRMTLGTTRLRIECSIETLTPETRAKLRAAPSSREVRAKLRAAKAGRPVHPNTIAALLGAAKRPKSHDWKRQQAERSRRMWQNRQAHGLPLARELTKEQIALIGTDTDRAIAESLHLPISAVAYERARRAISRAPRPWRADELALLGTTSDSEVARKSRRSKSAVRVKREQLGIPRFVVEWTEEEIALLGTASDRAIARRLRRSTETIKAKREQLGIPPVFRRWTEEEDSWLGIDTDRAIAKALERSVEAVKLRRKHFRIPVYRDR